MKLTKMQKILLGRAVKKEPLIDEGIPQADIDGQHLSLKSLRKKGLLTGKNIPTPAGVSKYQHLMGLQSAKGKKSKASTDPDWDGKCEVCEASPIVPETGMCGPCTFGEADTAGGNW